MLKLAALAMVCSALHGHNLDKAPGGRIVQAQDRLVGCTLPRGRARALTPVLGEDGFADVLASAGRFAVVDYYRTVDQGDGYDQKYFWERLYDLQTGRYRALWAYSYNAASEQEQLYDLGDPKRVVIDTHGRAAVAYSGGDEAGDDRAVGVFGSDGKRTVVARGTIPVSSLGLTGETVSWRQDGTIHSTSLADPQPAAR